MPWETRTGIIASSSDPERRRHLEKAADRHDLTIPQVAIAFVANKGIVPICGCRKPYQVEELKIAAETKLSAAEMKKLEEVADALNVTVLGLDLFRFAVRKGK